MTMKHGLQIKKHGQFLGVSLLNSPSQELFEDGVFGFGRSPPISGGPSFPARLETLQRPATCAGVVVVSRWLLKKEAIKMTWLTYNNYIFDHIIYVEKKKSLRISWFQNDKHDMISAISEKVLGKVWGLRILRRLRYATRPHCNRPVSWKQFKRGGRTMVVGVLGIVTCLGSRWVSSRKTRILRFKDVQNTWVMCGCSSKSNEIHSVKVRDRSSNWTLFRRKGAADLAGFVSGVPKSSSHILLVSKLFNSLPKQAQLGIIGWWLSPSTPSDRHPRAALAQPPPDVPWGCEDVCRCSSRAFGQYWVWALLPSANDEHIYGKSACWMGKSTINSNVQ